jgi:hypothetical protein
MKQTIYLLDANAIIELAKSLSPVIDGLDAKIDQTIKDGRIISVFEVFQELVAQGREDAPARWARRHVDLFMHPERAEADKLRLILSRSNEKSGYTKPFNADPWLVAFALSQPLSRQRQLFSDREYAVVTMDSGLKVLAEKFKVACVAWKDVFKREGWAPRLEK